MDDSFYMYLHFAQAISSIREETKHSNWNVEVQEDMVLQGQEVVRQTCLHHRGTQGYMQRQMVSIIAVTKAFGLGEVDSTSYTVTPCKPQKGFGVWKGQR